MTCLDQNSQFGSGSQSADPTKSASDPDMDLPKHYGRLVSHYYFFKTININFDVMSIKR